MDIKHHVQRFNTLKTDRQLWEDYWQELADIYLPVRADITTGTVKGEDRHSILFDGTPMRARRGLANAIDGLIKPKTKKWFSMVPSDEDLRDIDEVKRWAEEVVNIMWTHIYAKDARFVQRSGETDNDLVTFGTGYLFVGERSDLSGLIFKTIHPKDGVILENADGIIDTFYFQQMLTARQAHGRFGDKAGPKIKEALEKEQNSNKLFQFITAIFPREEIRPGVLLSTNLPFAKLIIEGTNNHLVEESGFHEFPLSVPRWDTATGEVYGRSPGMVGLADSRTLQVMGKTILVAGQKAVDPPLMVMDDSVIGTVRTFPGGITTIDAEAARGSQFPPVAPMQFGKDIGLGREMQNDTRQAVEAAFFKNVFSLPIAGPQMTATEIIERKEEFIREIGPSFGRLETDYIGHIVERVFGLLFRAGKFPEPPDILLDQDVEFEFQSPIQAARRQIEAVGASRGLELAAPFIEADPTLMDNFDGDQIVRDVPEVFGMPLKWLRDKEEVVQIREARVQAQQEQAERDIAQQEAQIEQAG